jgi:multidrug resistance efflux pump
MAITASPPDREGSAWREFVAARTPEEFYRSWLALQCEMIPGVRSGLVVAGASGSGRFVPVAVWPEGQAIQHLAQVAERALAERRGLVLRGAREVPASGVVDDRVDVGFPIEIDGRLHGVVAIDVAVGAGLDMPAVLRQLQWGAGWLEVLVHRIAALRVDLHGDEGARLRLEATLELVASALKYDRFLGAATAFATAAAARLACDRVSIGLIRKGRAHVYALSHSGAVDKRTNVIRGIEGAMDEAADQGLTVVWPSRPGADPTVTHAHAELARQQGSAAICTIRIGDGNRVAGAITFERLSGAPFDALTINFMEAVASVSGPILHLQWRNEHWIAAAGERARQAIGKLTGPGHAGMKLAAGVAAALVLFLAFTNGEHRVSSRTVIEARVKRAAVAPFSGYVREAPARAGDVVKTGQLLAALDDRGLQLQRARASSEADQLVREQQRALGGGNAAEAGIAAAQLAQVRAELALVEGQIARTRVVSSFDGIVVSGDLTQSLNAPVERGQVLFEVAPLADYRVVVQVDERDIAAVEPGQRGQLLLSAWPSDVLDFTVTKIVPVSVARDGRNYFAVEGALDRVPDRLRPGMEGVGKINVGERRLAWIWSRQGVDWFRLRLWAWRP